LNIDESSIDLLVEASDDESKLTNWKRLCGELDVRSHIKSSNLTRKSVFPSMIRTRWRWLKGTKKK